MSDESGRSTFSEGYVVPVLGLLSLAFALMAGLTAGRALSGDPADAVLPIAFGLGSILALWAQRRYTPSE
ncbi:hypothetical protein [Halorubrum sp. HHNYT27]|uniref:hypothetical protein n=1 Tax=Halorubrum sp. HHNYT27 TaxID=3402275 RepID=UPI003EBEE73E